MEGNVGDALKYNELPIESDVLSTFDNRVATWCVLFRQRFKEAFEADGKFREKRLLRIVNWGFLGNVSKQL